MGHNSNSKCPPVRCCSKCLCAYICAFIIVCITASVFIFIHWGIPMANIDFDIRDLHIELWKYGVHELNYHDVIKSIYLNGTGKFVVSAYSRMKLDAYMHDYHLDISALNVFGNPEQFGYVECCTKDVHFNKSHPYVGNETFVMDQEQDFWAGQKNNLSMILYITSITEELLYIGYEASFLNDWRLNLHLHGNGWAKTRWFGIHAQIALDCSIDVNSSYLLPLDPNVPWNISDWNITDSEDDSCDNRRTFGYDLEGMIRRLPPRKYESQIFPVIDLNCTIGMVRLRR